MRIKLLFAAALSACAMFANAQSLPNTNFENWTTDVDGNDSLMGWTSNHDAYQGSSPQWLYKNTSPYSGNYAANINSVGFGFISQPINGILVNGNAYIENALYDHIYRSGGGTPITGKPTDLTGYYRYEVAQTDHAMGMVVLFKYNSTTGERDTVGKGSMLLNPSSTWTPFTITINDMMPSVTPDSILTIFWASDTANPSAYQSLYLDQFQLNFPTSIEELSTVETSVYPNPAAGEAWIKFNAAAAAEARLELFNAQGQLVRSILQNVSPGVQHIYIDTHGLSEGLYLYTLSLPGTSGAGKILKE